MDTFSKIGINVGPVGRWTRLGLGIALILFIGADFYPVTHPHTLGTYVFIVASFFGLLLIFTSAHLLFGERLANKPAIWGTLIFVAPTIFLIVAPEFDPSMQLGYWLNFPELNHPFRLALLLYIGVSFLFQWRDKYGGCEVVSIPNFLFRKSYGSYCVPLLPLDFVEKKLMDRFRRSNATDS